MIDLELVVFHNGVPTPARRVLDDLQIHGCPSWALNHYLSSCALFDDGGWESPDGKRKTWRKKLANGEYTYRDSPPGKSEGGDGGEEDSGGSRVLGAAKAAYSALAGLSRTVLQGSNDGGISNYIDAIDARKKGEAAPLPPSFVRAVGNTTANFMSGVTHLAEGASRAVATACNMPGNIVRTALLTMAGHPKSDKGAVEGIKNWVGLGGSKESHLPVLGSTARYGSTVQNMIAMSGHAFAASAGAAAIAISAMKLLGTPGLDYGPETIAQINGGLMAVGHLAQHTRIGRAIVRAPGMAVAWAASKAGLIKEKDAEMAFFADGYLSPDDFPGLEKPLSVKKFKKLAGKFWAEVTAARLVHLLGDDPNFAKVVAGMAKTEKDAPGTIDKATASSMKKKTAGFTMIPYNGTVLPIVAVRADQAARFGLNGDALDNEIMALFGF